MIKLHVVAASKSAVIARALPQSSCLAAVIVGPRQSPTREGVPISRATASGRSIFCVTYRGIEALAVTPYPSARATRGPAL